MLPVFLDKKKLRINILKKKFTSLHLCDMNYKKEQISWQKKSSISKKKKEKTENGSLTGLHFKKYRNLYNTQTNKLLPEKTKAREIIP